MRSPCEPSEPSCILMIYPRSCIHMRTSL
ncbi:hypothetical protein KP509_23G003800 [Ceratopteris richardii]|uniref:Uncharacterized protein n=1 Tax=Ceratopteris richardii TaxID=49495 RepID=A0A8T2RWR4_CERRI|nr:hypothetical protein KP509_23G003800 [Ceratopteris richardii]